MEVETTLEKTEAKVAELVALNQKLEIGPGDRFNLIYKFYFCPKEEIT